jgi:CRISPR-associated protein Cmr5
MTQETNPHNIEQRRAKAAFDLVESYNNCYKEKPTKSDRLKSYARSLPTMILINGFGQAMAFAKAKSDSEPNKEEGYAYHRLYKSIQDWLSGEKLIPIDPQNPDLVKAITEITQQEYQIATAETLAYCKWIKQLATALIPSKDNSNVT